MGIATLISLIAIGAIGAWSRAMITLALVLTALLFCIVIGLPTGDLAGAQSTGGESFVRCWMRCKPRQRSFIWCPS